ncbi:hypothetical protein [Virgibacillus kimchii]
MRKVLILSISIFILFLLYACQGNTTESSEVFEADLTGREEAILSTTAEQSFVFDFHTGEEFDELTVLVERYESGELIDNKLIYFSTEIQEKGTIIFAVSGMKGSGDQLMLQSGISSNNAVSVSRNETALPDENLSSVWGSNPNENDPAEGEMVLASILYSSDEGGMSSLPDYFYEDVDEHLDELEDSDIAFLLKAEFK